MVLLYARQRCIILIKKPTNGKNVQHVISKTLRNSKSLILDAGNAAFNMYCIISVKKPKAKVRTKTVESSKKNTSKFNFIWIRGPFEITDKLRACYAFGNGKTD